MKYIRAKDGIYIPCKIDGYKDYYCLKGNMNVSRLDELDILKQADTIDELCDAWIIVPIRVNCNPFVRHISENISHFINSSHVIFAGIWTKGEHNEPILKPVAKMNEKGDLELL